MCIFCYLNSFKQYKIRKGIQLRSDRFEHTLNKYKLSFIHKFNDNLNENLCDNHDTPSNIIILNELKKINTSEINDFFDELKKIYICWINSEPKKSITAFEELLNKYKILESSSNMNGKVLFRGRKCESFLSHWDMFHIPFNRRFLIGNQRYSLVGQPILYLATSPYCVFKELDTTKDIKISSFRLAYEKDSEKTLNFFNNSNNLNNLIEKKNTEFTTLKIDSLIHKDIDTTIIKRTFFQFILYCCCSFTKKNFTNSYFCEEYVLPQILAQIIKSSNKFDGIIFDSTKCFDDEKLAGNQELFDLMCKNICIFTNYDLKQSTDVRYVYDRELYKKLSISSTLSYEHSNIEEDYHCIDKSLQIVKSLLSKNLDQYHTDLLYEINNFSVICKNINDSISEDDFIFISDKNKDLFTNSINLHNLLLRNIILNICDDFH